MAEGPSNHQAAPADDKQLESNVRVAVRVRPFIAREIANGVSSCVAADEGMQCIALGRDRRFTFDNVFSPAATQESIYNGCVAPLVASCFQGFNATVLAYGQTGSGKTHTMWGPPSNNHTGSRSHTNGSRAGQQPQAPQPQAGTQAVHHSPHAGIIPRAVAQVFAMIAQHEQAAQRRAGEAGSGLCQSYTASGAAGASTRWVVGVQFLEIHNEEVRDLLALLDIGSGTSGGGSSSVGTKGGSGPQQQPIPIAIREGSDGEITVAGVREVQVETQAELMDIIAAATQARSTGSTLMNESSSRSHAICTLTLTQLSRPSLPANHHQLFSAQHPAHERLRAASGLTASSEQLLRSSAPSRDAALSSLGLGSALGALGLCGTQGGAETVVCSAKLHLVDLAGSERTKRSGVAGMLGPSGADASMLGSISARFKETVNINQGLLALGNVISALGDTRKQQRGNVHVPYRDSKLTRLLADSLGGNSRTLMIACISAADDSLDESLSTLKYANRARNIRNQPLAQRVPDTDSGLSSLQVDVLRLQLALAKRCAAHALPFSLAADPELSELVRLLNLPACQGLGSAAACSEATALLEAEQVALLQRHQELDAAQRQADGAKGGRSTGGGIASILGRLPLSSASLNTRYSSSVAGGLPGAHEGEGSQQTTAAPQQGHQQQELRVASHPLAMEDMMMGGDDEVLLRSSTTSTILSLHPAARMSFALAATSATRQSVVAATLGVQEEGGSSLGSGREGTAAEESSVVGAATTDAPAAGVLEQQVRELRAALAATQLALKAAQDDLHRDEAIFADQQRELQAAHAALQHHQGTPNSTTAPALSGLQQALHSIAGLHADTRTAVARGDEVVPPEKCTSPTLGSPRRTASPTRETSSDRPGSATGGGSILTSLVLSGSPPTTARGPSGMVSPRTRIARRPSGGIEEVEEAGEEGPDGSREGRISATATVKGSRGTHDDVLLFSDSDDDNGGQGQGREGEGDNDEKRGAGAGRRKGGSGRRSRAGLGTDTSLLASQSQTCHLGHGIKASWMSASGVTEGVLTPGDSMALRDSSNPVGISHAGGDGVSQSEETGEMAAALEAAQAERQALERDKAALEQQAAQQQQDFELLREALESRLRSLTGSIALQEQLIQSLQAAEREARELSSACLERMRSLEAQISERETELGQLRQQLADLEDNLVARSEEEKAAVRAEYEARIVEAQAQVAALRRQLADGEGTRLERERQRALARAQALEAELRQLRVEQDALQRRLVERATSHEREARQRAQEVGSLRRAADAARRRIAELELENKAHKALAKQRHEEAANAKLQLRAAEASRRAGTPSSAATGATNTPSGARMSPSMRSPLRGQHGTFSTEPFSPTSHGSSAGGSASTRAGSIAGGGGGAVLSRSPSTRISPAPSLLPPFSPSQPSEGSPGRRMLKTAPTSLGGTGGGASGGANSVAAVAGVVVKQGQGERDGSGDADGPGGTHTVIGQTVPTAGVTAFSTMGTTVGTATSVLMDSWLQQQVSALVAKQEAEARAQRLDSRLKALQGRRSQLVADLATLKQHLRTSLSRYMTPSGLKGGAGGLITINMTPRSPGRSRLCHSSTSQDPAPGNDSGQGPVTPGAAAAQVAAAIASHPSVVQMEDEMDDLETELAYVESELAAVRKAAARAQGAGIELRRRIAGMAVHDVRKALQVAVEALAQGPSCQPHAALQQQQQGQARMTNSDGGGGTSNNSGTAAVQREVPTVPGTLVRTISAPSPSQPQPAGAASAAAGSIPTRPPAPTPPGVPSAAAGGAASVPGTPSSVSKRARSAGGAIPPPLPPLPLHTLTASPSILDRPPPTTPAAAVTSTMLATVAEAGASPSRRLSASGSAGSGGSSGTPTKTVAAAAGTSPSPVAAAGPASHVPVMSNSNASGSAAAAGGTSKRRNSCMSAFAATAAAALTVSTAQANCRSPSPPPAQLGDGASLLAHARSNSLNGAPGGHAGGMHGTPGVVATENERWPSPSSTLAGAATVPPRSPVAGPITSGSGAPRPAGLLSRSPSVTLPTGHTGRAGVSSSGTASQRLSGSSTGSNTGVGDLIPDLLQPDDDEPPISFSAHDKSRAMQSGAERVVPVYTSGMIRQSPPSFTAQRPAERYQGDQGSSWASRGMGLVAHEVGASLRSWPSIEVESNDRSAGGAGAARLSATSTSSSHSSAGHESVTWAGSHTSCLNASGQAPGQQQDSPGHTSHSVTLSNGVRGPGACPGVRASSANVSAALASYKSHMVRLSTSLSGSPFKPLAGKGVSLGGGNGGTAADSGSLAQGGGAEASHEVAASPQPPSLHLDSGQTLKSHKRQGSTGSGAPGGMTALQMMATGALGDGSVVVSCSPVRRS